MSFKIGDRVILQKETYNFLWAYAHQLFLDTEYIVTGINHHDVFIRTIKEEHQAIDPHFIQFPDPWGALLCNCRNNHTFTPKCLDCILKHYP